MTTKTKEPDWALVVVGLIIAIAFAAFVAIHDHTSATVSFCEDAVTEQISDAHFMGDTDYKDGSVYGEFKHDGFDMNYWCDTSGTDSNRTLDTLDVRFS